MMGKLQFWNSINKYKTISIETYYLAEQRSWLFVATDIFRVFDSINKSLELSEKQNSLLKYPKNLHQIKIYKNNQWQNIDVMEAEVIIGALNETICDDAKSFQNFIIDICKEVPKDCFLAEDCAEYEFLQLSTNRFLDLYNEINDIAFFNLSEEVRYYKLKDFFSVYTELLSYSAMKEQIQLIEKVRPPMEAIISSEFVKFVRNVLIHFPCFTKWNEIYVSKHLVNWKSEGQSIDRFLTRYQGREPIELRVKDCLTGKWRYPLIKFPSTYNDNKIFLKDMIDEKDGVLLCAVLMYKVVSSQIIVIPEDIQK